MNVGLLIFLVALVSLLLIRYFLSDSLRYPLQANSATKTTGKKFFEDHLQGKPAQSATNVEGEKDDSETAGKFFEDHLQGKIAQSATAKKEPKTVQFYFSLFVLTAVLIASLTVILKGSYTDSTHEWAYGAVGMILGFCINIKS